MKASLNHYEIKIAAIKASIVAGKWQEAAHELQKELDMPYIPVSYEQTFIKLYQDVKAQLSSSDKQVRSLTRAEVIELLFSNDSVREMLALELLPEHNLRLAKIEIKQRIETWPLTRAMERAYLFELLVEQEVDIDILFQPNMLLNPQKSKTILVNNQVAAAYKTIDEHFLQNPTLAQTAKQELERYLLIMYPLTVVNGSLLGEQVAHVVRLMFGEEQRLDINEQAIYHVLQR